MSVIVASCWVEVNAWRLTQRKKWEFGRGSDFFVKHVVEGRQTCYANGRFETVACSTRAEVKS
jgi:hypothetical protein